MNSEFINEFVTKINCLKLENLDDFMSFYSQNCIFSDPFHSTSGKNNIKNIYKSMFKNLVTPRFEDLKVFSSESELMIKWMFSFRKSVEDESIKIPGVSCLVLNNENLISVHQDLWDGSELLAAYFPISIPINWAKTRVRKNL